LIDQTRSTKVRTNRGILIAIIAVVGLAALFFVILMFSQPDQGEQPTATTDPNAVYTAAAQTADVRLTEVLQSTPSPTSEPALPTPDAAQTEAAAQTAQAALTAAAGASPTSGGPTATSAAQPTASQADRATYVADVTIPDGTQLNPGASFTKTWRLLNAGTSTWTTAYALVFVSGDKMGDNTSAPLSVQVAPGATVDISVSLVAPATAGTYRGYWKMRNASGAYFDETIYVEIIVGAGGTPVASSTPPAGSTPVPTPTSGGGGSAVSNLSFAVDQASFTGACPHTFTFAASFTVNQQVSLTYRLEAGSDTPGFEFNLPPEQFGPFSPGPYTLSFPLAFNDTAAGWVRFHITAPADLTSNQVEFTLTCE
jgi:hypothetical protein